MVIEVLLSGVEKGYKFSCVICEAKPKAEGYANSSWSDPQAPGLRKAKPDDPLQAGSGLRGGMLSGGR